MCAMANYEFLCEQCGRNLELTCVSMGEAHSRPCECGGELKQRFYPSAIFMGKMPMSGHRKWSHGGAFNDPRKP